MITFETRAGFRYDWSFGESLPSRLQLNCVIRIEASGKDLNRCLLLLNNSRHYDCCRTDELPNFDPSSYTFSGMPCAHLKCELFEFLNLKPKRVSTEDLNRWPHTFRNC